MKFIDSKTIDGVLHPVSDLGSFPSVLAWQCNGTQFVGYEAGDEIPGTEPTLAQRRDMVWEAIKARRDELSDTGGYKVPVDGVDKWFHSDVKSKLQQVALKDMGASVPAVAWKTMDGSFVTMTPALAAAVFQAGAAQDMAIFAAAEAHRAAMQLSGAPESYDFSGGWPAVYPGAA